MNEIKCPSCGKVFQIDEKDYESIAKQIRNHEFEEELKRREKEFAKEKNSELEKLENKLNLKNTIELADKDKEIEKLKNEIDKKGLEVSSEYRQQISDKDIEIEKLKKQIEQSETENSLALKNAVQEKETEILNLRNQIKQNETENSLALKNAVQEKETEILNLRNQIKQNETENSLALKNAVQEKETEILNLRNQIEQNETENSLALKNAVQEKETEILNLRNQIKQNETENKLTLKEAMQEKENEILNLKSQIELNEKEYQLKEQNLKETHKKEVQTKEQEIELYKDMKLKLSTKMIGESLEQHCKMQYEEFLRPVLKNAYFEKDNDAKSGSKGDFIFRDKTDDEIEFISIMFEMKNEADETATKHKNEDFFKELDKDRKEKNCEYAVLVSMLEKDNDYYNAGIVDVSHKYEKMYVIRPQSFITIINILRNASLKSIDDKRELIRIQNQNIDISHFEENMNNFKDAFGRNFKLASDKFDTAIEEIDKSILHLQKIKDNLLGSKNQLRLANDKAEDLSIKKLTAGSPSIAQKFEEMGVEINKKKSK